LAVLEFEDLAGNTGEDGNILFLIYVDSDDAYRLKIAPENVAKVG
jgi:hypothetical protein